MRRWRLFRYRAAGFHEPAHFFEQAAQDVLQLIDAGLLTDQRVVQVARNEYLTDEGPQSLTLWQVN